MTVACYQRTVEAVQYLPHLNCAAVAEFLDEPHTCDGVGDSTMPWELPDGRELQPGDWLVRTPTGVEIYQEVSLA